MTADSLNPGTDFDLPARPAAPPVAPATRLREAGIVLAIAVLALIVRAPYLGDPAADYDEQLYSVIGQAWLSGSLPYVDMWDRKPPGLFALFAAMHWIGGPSPLAFQIPGLLATIGAAVMVYALARDCGTRFGAFVVAALFLLNIPLFILHMGQSETFLLPVLLGQCLLLRRAFRLEDRAAIDRALFALMLSGGLALQIKYSVAPFCALFAAAAVLRLRQTGMGARALAARLLAYAALGLAPTAVFAAYFAYHGAFDAFFFANFVSILERGAMDADLVRRFWVHIAVAAFPLCVFAGLGWAAATRERARVDALTMRLAAGFAAAGAVALVMLGNAFVHYFGPLLPFLCVLASPFFSFHASHRLFAALALGLAIICASFPEQMARTRSGRSATAAFTQAIRTTVPPGECLLVFDGPAILYATGQRCPATRLVFPDHLTNRREKDALDVDVVAETRRILARRPGAIVVTDGLRDPRLNAATTQPVLDVLERDYIRIERAFYYPRMIELHLRKDLLADRGKRRPRQTVQGVAR